jgi:GrpB-like predicted nucleotidyltransferase (UPF0157 family)
MGVRLVHHDPEWADIYERTATDIRDALGEDGNIYADAKSEYVWEVVHRADPRREAHRAVQVHP